jgi:hypothetical protein
LLIVARITRAAGVVGRPSRSLSLEQSLSLLEAARDSRLNAYVVLSLTVGIRTEEARELRWDHVDLGGDPKAVRPEPPSVAVWRSVRHGGDPKTAMSRRTLALPRTAVQALREMSADGVPIEELGRLAGHNRTATTEVVYRHELSPVITTGAPWVRACSRAACTGGGCLVRLIRDTVR